MRLCDRVDFVESLYDAQGMPNFSHYYWRVSGYKTAQGPDGRVSIVAQTGFDKERLQDASALVSAT